MEKPEKESKRGKKLYYYLSRLSPKELKDLHAYFQSPLLGNSPQMARMLLVIQRDVLDKGGQVIDADLFREEFFPDEPLDEGKRKYIRIRLVQFLDRVLDFVAFMDYRGDVNAKDVHLLRALHNRGAVQYFEQTYQEIDSKPPVKQHGEYYLHRLRLEIIRYEYLGPQLENGRSLNDHEIHHWMDCAFSFLKARFSTISFGMHLRDGKLRQPAFVDETIATLEALDPDIYPEKVFLLPILLAFRNYDPTDSIVQEQMIGLIDQLPKTSGIDIIEAREICESLLGYCGHGLRYGQGSLLPEIKKIIHFQLHSKLVLDEGFIPKKIYKNYTSMMVKLNEIEWATNFVEEWKNRVSGDSNLYCYYHNQCTILLTKNEYRKVIELLYNRIFKFEDEIYITSSMVYLCRSLWELGDWDWLGNILQSFRQYLRRNKRVTPLYKEGHLQFVSFLQKLLNATMGPKDKKAHKLKLLLELIFQNGGRERFSWLSKQVHLELEKSKSLNS